MTIIILIGGTEISEEIHLNEMQPWFGQPKTITHSPDGGVADIVYKAGKHSRSTTIGGYCKRTKENIKELERIAHSDKIAVIRRPTEEVHQGIVTAMSLKTTAGGTFITFSMTVVEQ